MIHLILLKQVIWRVSLSLFTPFRVFNTSVSRWFLTGVWVTVKVLSSVPEYPPILIMHYFLMVSTCPSNFHVFQSLYQFFGDCAKSSNYNWYHYHFHILVFHYYYYYYYWKFFTPKLADSLLLKSERQLVSSGQQDSSQYLGRYQLYCNLDGLDSSYDF